MGKLHLVYLSAQDADAKQQPNKPAAVASTNGVLHSPPPHPLPLGHYMHAAAPPPLGLALAAYQTSPPLSYLPAIPLPMPVTSPTTLAGGHGGARGARVMPHALAAPYQQPTLAAGPWSPPPAPAASASSLSSARVYACGGCGAHLAHSRAIESRAFQGHSGRAYLFGERGVVNVREGEMEERNMTTGLHAVRDVHCIACDRIVGWRYVYAFEQAQKYKEGKYILERGLIQDVVERDDDDDDDEVYVNMEHGSARGGGGIALAADGGQGESGSENESDEDEDDA